MTTARQRVLERLERQWNEHYGLPPAQLHAAHMLSSDIVALMCTIALLDGLTVRSPGAGLAKLQALGFISIGRANGHDRTTARLTQTGYKALVLRLLKRTPMPAPTR
jgi:hypothetical protein